MSSHPRDGRAEARPYARDVGSHFSATDLDDTIDRVAAKLVAVTDESCVLQQVMARLPERAVSPWFMTMPVQLAAGAALVLIAFLCARPSRESASIEPSLVAVAEPVTSRVLDPGPRMPEARVPGPGSRIPTVAIDRPDHERSLEPVEPVQALELDLIAAPALELDAAAALEPLVLTELPLASDASSPRER